MVTPYSTSFSNKTVIETFSTETRNMRARKIICNQTNLLCSSIEIQCKQLMELTFNKRNFKKRIDS